MSKVLQYTLKKWGISREIEILEKKLMKILEACKHKS